MTPYIPIYHKGGKNTYKVTRKWAAARGYTSARSTLSKCKSSARVELSNKSSREGRTVSADGVKIGGGMGNIARTAPPILPSRREMPNAWPKWVLLPKP